MSPQISYAGEIVEVDTAICYLSDDSLAVYQQFECCSVPAYSWGIPYANINRITTADGTLLLSNQSPELSHATLSNMKICERITPNPGSALARDGKMLIELKIGCTREDSLICPETYVG